MLERLADAADQAWNRGDAEGMSRYYVDEANLRLSSMAEPLKGRDALRSYFSRSFAGRTTSMRHVTKIEDIDMLGPDLALSDGIVRVERDDGNGGWALVREYRNNSLAVRRNGRWQLAAVRAFALPNAK